MTYKYVIIDADEVDLVDFSQVAEHSAQSLRYSIDLTKTFVKYTGEQPSFLAGKTEYDNAGIINILRNDTEWAE